MTADIQTITTPRLILCPLELSDADAIQSVFPQWEIVQFLAADIPWPYPLAPHSSTATRSSFAGR